jgi:hypothetical protein
VNFVKFVFVIILFTTDPVSTTWKNDSYYKLPQSIIYKFLQHWFEYIHFFLPKKNKIKYIHFFIRNTFFEAFIRNTYFPKISFIFTRNCARMMTCVCYSLFCVLFLLLQLFTFFCFFYLTKTLRNFQESVCWDTYHDTSASTTLTKH